MPHAREGSNLKCKCKLDQRQIEDGRKRRERSEVTSSSSRMKGGRRKGEKWRWAAPLYGPIAPARLA